MKVNIQCKGKIPSKKNRMKTTRSGAVYKDLGVKRFEKWLGLIAVSEMRRQGQIKTSDPISLRLDVTFGDRRRRDLQNCFGAVCDSLEGVVYDDDSQITEIRASKCYVQGVWAFDIRVSTAEG